MASVSVFGWTVCDTVTSEVHALSTDRHTPTPTPARMAAPSAAPSGETKLDIAKALCVVCDDVAPGGDLNVIRTNQNGVLSYYTDR